MWNVFNFLHSKETSGSMNDKKRRADVGRLIELHQRHRFIFDQWLAAIDQSKYTKALQRRARISITKEFKALEKLR